MTGSSNRDGGTPTAYDDMIAALRGLLDKVAAAEPDPTTIEALAGDLERWSDRLAPFTVGPREPSGLGHPRRDRALTPTFTLTGQDDRSIQGSVLYGRHFGESAAHGGAVPLLMLDVLGRLVNSAPRPRSRTAYLHVDYRASTPIGVELSVKAWIVSETGRKRVLRGELRHGDTLCAEAEGLFVAVRAEP